LFGKVVLDCASYVVTHRGQYAVGKIAATQRHERVGSTACDIVQRVYALLVEQ